MGYIKNDAVIAIVPEYGRGIAEARSAIEAISADLDSYDRAYGSLAWCLVGPVPKINGGDIYALLPDGSKEGWGPSDYMDDIRQRFIAACRLSEYAEIVHVQFGGDDRQTVIQFTTDGLATPEEDSR